MRADWLKIWIARQPRSTPRSIALARPPAGETCAPISMRADYEGSLRTIADGRAAHRRRADRPVAHGGTAPQRGRARAAHRAHRPGALDARERGADHRRAALARAR